MTSSAISAGEFDNDEFDWEAAVREIDSACAAAATSVSYQEPISCNDPNLVAGACPRAAKPNGKAGQPTIDRFFDSYQKRIEERKDQGRRSLCGESPSILNEGGDQALEVTIDLEAAKTWIYPVNVPLRDYQFAITKTALFSNTLVALPTGLGKTLIAAVVMYNYFRWFPEGKIVFTAPSRPLVMQQIEACHNIVGIPQEWTIDMTGQMNPHKRSVFWKRKRVFFVTPQVLEKDIQSGICLVKQLVCLVIDEAHRALGGFSYCVAVRELLAVPVQLRILALTATPGSKHHTIQDVINNLCISTLEYRNESHPDVSPHVHKRKVELIEVALGKDAIGISNMLSEAVRPLVNQLCNLEVLHKRDFATMSPCELLVSRDKFRQAPPLNLPHAKFGEVERWFASLITLCHIRKLLTSHGIRPAYEMLEEKLQGFARHLSKNEAIQRVKLLMQQSLSHGTPNPKLVKLMEILIDHFRTNDPKDSRVIIFSNFRGSVKDIMNSLTTIGDLIKATEFIGQSSGKALKGQTQKMQQAVLQKFRTGGYNVIVATSIGEEGLDIMEVDLVICFDANISPLRMIQRMGRTGRKHDGRVVVLACEGSELKGYLKKQASGKAVGKHMHNGGTKSFDFHSSPRMIPHICKPEVQFVERSIEQFIPRGRRLKDDGAESSFIKKTSDREKDLLSKYFHPSQADSWRPSLISFPHFQCFPSRVHKVRHSFKSTGMLIDAMQHLQGLSASKAKKVEASICSLEGGIFIHDKREEALVSVDCTAKNGLEAFFQTKDSDDGKSCIDASLGEGENHLPDDPMEKLLGHQFLFGEDFATVNASGNVSIASVPVLLHGGILVSNIMTEENDKEFHHSAVRDPGTFGMSDRKFELSIDMPYAGEVTVSTELRCFGNETLGSRLLKYTGQEGHGTDVIEVPAPKRDPTNLGVTSEYVNHNPENDIQMPSGERSRDHSMDIDLSPRLSYYLEEGVVPESPAGEINQYSSKAEAAVCKRSIFTFDCNGLQPKCPSSMTNEKVLTDSPSFSVTLLNDAVLNESPEPVPFSPDVIDGAGSLSKHFPNSSIKAVGKVQTAVELKSEEKVSDHFTGEEAHTTIVKRPNNSSSEEWPLNPEDVPKSLPQPPKYKRLRKYGDACRNKPYAPVTYGHIREANMEGKDFEKGKQKPKKYFRSFIDEEAEVSEDATVSQDEEESENDDEYEDSFIDDKVSAREATEPVNSGDMLAFYRRSLLTQSPAVLMATGFIPSHEPATPRTTESGSSSVKTSTFLQASEEGLISDDPSTQRKASDRLESRKRKLSFQHAGASLATDQQPEHVWHLQRKVETPPHHQSGGIGTEGELPCDDDFYQSIDLDAVEEQATKLLRYRYELSITQTQAAIRNHMETKSDTSGIISVPPTFDLGI